MYGCRDTDELRAFLKTIATYDEWWSRKEPDFSDADEKAFWDAWIVRFSDDPQLVLEVLKQAEVRRFVREQTSRHPTNLN
jgi:hypothetical protein